MVTVVEFEKVEALCLLRCLVKLEKLDLYVKVVVYPLLLNKSDHLICFRIFY